MTVIVKNVSHANLIMGQMDLSTGEGEFEIKPSWVKEIPYSYLLRTDIRQMFKRGFLDVVSWPEGKLPIRHIESPTIYQFPDGKYKRVDLPEEAK